VLSANLRVTGYDAIGWSRLVSLFEARRPPGAREEPSSTFNVLVVGEDTVGAACAAFVANRGAVRLGEYSSRADLPRLCEEHGVRRAVAVKLGTIEELTERAAEHVLRTDDYAAQWLALLSAMRELEREGALYFWPERNAVPLPSPQLVTR